MEVIYVIDVPYDEIKKIVFNEAMHASHRDAHIIFEKIQNVKQLRNESNFCVNLSYFDSSIANDIKHEIVKHIQQKKKKIEDELESLRFKTLTEVNTRCDKLRAMSYVLNRLDSLEEKERYYIRIT